MLFMTVVMAGLVSCKVSTKPADSVQAYLLRYSDSLDISLQQLVLAVDRNEPSQELQQKFERARRHYKYLEPFTELYFPGFSEAVNGPAIDEMEAYEGEKITEASGFQVVEEYLYPGTDTAEYTGLVREAKLLASSCNRLKQLLNGNTLTDEHIFQALRLELIRISTLGISGFDSPVALQSLPEAKVALLGIREVLGFYAESVPEEDLRKLDMDALFNQAVEHLSASDFNSFDRGAFIARDIRKISIAVHEYQTLLGIGNRQFLSAVDLSKPYFMDAGAFQTAYFVNPSNRTPAPQMIWLGKLLFFDPVLSGNNQRACASCHQPAKAFTDHRPKSLAFEGKGDVLRNAPTIINSSYQRMQFYDSRVMFLEDQVNDVVANPAELHGRMEEAVEKLKKSSEYQVHFDIVFGDSGITPLNIQRALASYISSLTSLNSPFDQYMRGDELAISEEALSGFTLFMGKAKCGTCHFMPLFNGTVPPLYTKSESEVLGVPANTDTLHSTADSDPGKFLAYGGDLNRHAFKTPTVRNAALTAPYMHNGVYNTLEEVIDFYNRGGGEGIGIHLENQTLPPDRLNLTAREKKQLAEFIQALNDTTGLTSVPPRLPSFEDEQLNKRKTGGVY